MGGKAASKLVFLGVVLFIPFLGARSVEARHWISTPAYPLAHQFLFKVLDLLSSGKPLTALSDRPTFEELLKRAYEEINKESRRRLNKNAEDVIALRVFLTWPHENASLLKYPLLCLDQERLCPLSSPLQLSSRQISDLKREYHNFVYKASGHWWWSGGGWNVPPLIASRMQNLRRAAQLLKTTTVKVGVPFSQIWGRTGSWWVWLPSPPAAWRCGECHMQSNGVPSICLLVVSPKSNILP